MAAATKIDIVLRNATVYDINKFDVATGEKYTLLSDHTDEGVRWFSNNDSVLAINVHPDTKSALITAGDIGECEILLMKGTTIIKTLYVKVTEVIVATLGLSAGTATLKQ